VDVVGVQVDRLACDDTQALIDPTGRAYTRTEFERLIAHRVSRLTDAGATDEMVTLSVPDPTSLAVEVLATIRVGIAAPFDPNATMAECSAYLSQLRPRFVVTTASSPMRAAAEALAITIVDSHTCRDICDLEGGTDTFADRDPTATALLMPSSGTTGRPKIVVLTHGNLAAQAANVASSLELTSHDRCLGLVPYYHINGLISGLLAPLSVGGSVIAAGGLDPGKIRKWIEDFQPTWSQPSRR
jgi:acyl-CoA synthetase (AMP-forming)/AMP-acid ligase II